MFDIGWSELLLIGVVALVVIGPKELPGVLRTLGQWMRKVRGMAADFQNQFQEAMREAEMDDLKKQVDAAASEFTSFDPLGDVKKNVEAMGRDFETSLEPKPALPAGSDAETPAADAAPETQAGTQAETPVAEIASESHFPIADAAAELELGDKDVAATATGPVTPGAAKPDNGGQAV
jgi:sec-independent protein translocase protein TatB